MGHQYTGICQDPRIRDSEVESTGLRDRDRQRQVTGICLKTTQFFSFQKISTNTVARGIQSFGRNGPWRAGCLSKGLNFYVNLAHTYDEEMLKVLG